jgi:tetratricopeptide (TPR) repeat protein
MPLCPVCSQPFTQGRFCGRCGGRLPPPPGTLRVSTVDPTVPDDSPIGPADLDRLAAAVKDRPGSAEPYVRLAEALFRAGKGERALSTYRAAQAVAPDDRRIDRLGAQLYDALGRRDEALELYERLLILDPSDVQAGLESARLLHEAGRREDSLQRLQTLRAQAETHPEILVRLAEIELSLNDAKSAQADLSAYRRLVGNTLDMFLLMGQAMMVQKFFDGAVKLYREALEAFHDDTDLRLGLGRAFLALQDRGQALLEFERAFATAPQRVEILLEMGKLAGDMGMEDKAEDLFERIRAQYIRDGEIFLDMARYYRQRKDMVKAVAHLERARECSPHHPEIIRLLGDVLEGQQAFAKALAEYESFAREHPEAHWALKGVVRCALALKKFDRAAEAQRSLLTKGSGSAEAWCEYGETLIRILDFDDAERAFEEAARLDPTCTRAYQAPELIKIEKARAQAADLVVQAQDALDKRFFLTAIERLERALDLVPREGDYMRRLAQVCLRTGERGKASDLLSRLRSIDPHDVDMGIQLARLYEWDGKPQLAIDLLGAVLRDQIEHFEGQLTLLRLKRGQVAGDRFGREVLAAVVQSIRLDTALVARTSILPKLLEGYAHLLFGVGSKFQAEALTKAESLFRETLQDHPQHIPALRGLATVYRATGDVRQAGEYLNEVVRAGTDPQALYALARLHENFQHFTEAHKCYSSLRNLFPDHGLYRRKVIEMLGQLSDASSKNELMNHIGVLQEQIAGCANPMWFLHDLAFTQALIARRTTQREEWARRSLLTWHKANSQPNPAPWIQWGLMETQLEFLRGTDRFQALTAQAKMCEKLVREHPDLPYAHAFLGVCYLGYQDLTQTERGLGHLETAFFLAPQAVDIALSIARAAREVGRPNEVDAVRHYMILLEPELTKTM